MIPALAAAVGVVGERVLRWIAAAAALLGFFWLSNRRERRRGARMAEQDATEQANRDAIDAMRTRQQIDRRAGDGASRERLRDRLRQRQKG